MCEHKQPGNTPTILETQRLSLHRLDRVHLDHLVELAADWDVARMTGQISYPVQREQFENWLDKLDDKSFVCAIKNGDKIIGSCGYYILPDTGACNGDNTTPSASLSYWLGKEFWGQGFASEASQTIINRGIREGIKKFFACYFLDNPASGRILEKLGFQKTKRCDDWCQARATTVTAQFCELNAK